MLTLAMAEGTKLAVGIRFAYTIEALIKIKVLRVFVYARLDGAHNHLQPQTHEDSNGCPSSRVGPSLHGAEVALVEGGGATVMEVSIADSQAHSFERQCLKIPLPEEVVVDRQSLSVIQRPDHLELKLRIAASLGEGNWGTKSSSSSFQMKPFQEKGYFACGGCGQPVVEQGIEHFFPMPSENWEELADHWFDLQCGCGGPVKASLLARKVQARLVPTRATCLVGTTSYLLHESDLVASGGEGEKERGFSSDESLEGDLPIERERMVVDPLESGLMDEASFTNGNDKSRGVSERQRRCGMQLTNEQSTWDAATIRPASASREFLPHLPKHVQDEHCERDASEIGPSDERESRRQKSLDEESSRAGNDNASGASSASFCGHLESAADVAVELGPERIRELAEGPIEPTEPLSGARKWVRFRCPCCAETLGVRRSTEADQTTVSSSGVYLFKHRVVSCGGASTSPSRKSTREALLGHFSARLQQAAEHSLCSRFLLQGLLTGKPYCQVTVLSRETFVWSGCLDRTSDGSERSQGLKILLAYPGEAEAGTETDAKRNKHFERVFLLEDDAEEVLRILVANNEKYPLSCRTFNGASLSFL